jgi:class 3 adenylate cyclase/tetratricopeptide (TPR) repeat protein
MLARAANRKLAAVLAADVVGYSRLMERDEEGTHAQLMRLRRTVLDPKIGVHRGQIIKNTGDGFLALFDSAVDATQCALDIQQSVVSSAKQQSSDTPLHFRIGVHVADVIVEKDDVYGDGVNIAARLQSYAEPGGIVVSGAVSEQIGGGPDIRVSDLGELHLRNMARPVRAFSLRGVSTSRENVADALAGTESRPSIVVLPFREHHAEQTEAYFAEGIVDNIILVLGGLRELFVISRASTLGYSGGPIDVRAIGRELGVRYVLHGNVRRSGHRLRIATALDDAETGTIVFADQYDGELRDLFKLQDEIAIRVVTTIAPHVRDRERTRAIRKHPENMSGYDLVLQALALMYRMDHESFSRAGGLLQQAIAHDPSYAPAYSYSALWRMFRVAQGWSPDPSGDNAEASRTAIAAIDRDENDALALAIHGHVKSFLMKEYDSAMQLFDRALAVGPNCALAWTFSSATCGYLGEGATAVLRAEHGLQLSPRDSYIFLHEHLLSQAHYINNNYDEAIRWATKSAQRNQRLTANLRILTASLVTIGKIEDARRVGEQLLALEPNFGLKWFAARTPLRGVILEKFVERLRAAGLPELTRGAGGSRAGDKERF